MDAERTQRIERLRHLPNWWVSPPLRREFVDFVLALNAEVEALKAGKANKRRSRKARTNHAEPSQPQ